MPKLVEFTKGKILGNGMIGTVYEALPGKEYIIKVEKFNQGQKSIWWKNTFAFEMGTLYPNHFLELADYEISNKCKHIQKYSGDISKLPKIAQKEFKTLADSRYCITRLYTRVDTTLCDIPNYNSLLCQFFYITYLIKKHGYVHNDLHRQNLGVTYTDKEFIDIEGRQIPTFGFLYKALDYGTVVNKWFGNLSKNDLDKFSPERDDNNRIFEFTTYCNIGQDHKFPSQKVRLEKVRKLNLPIKVTPPNAIIELNMCCVLYFEQWKKIVNFGPDIILEKYLPDKDYIFFAKNWDNHLALIDYFSVSKETSDRNSIR